jgi:uncharacterized membrane protein
MFQFIVLAVVYLLLDAIWLMGIAKPIYVREMGSLMNMYPPIFSVVLVYVLLLFGLMFFVLPKAAGNPWLALVFGALYGLVVYGVYNFTNLAIVSGWTLKISVIDLFWGIFVCAISSFLAVFLTR